jgi:hypothetical protein
MGCGSSKNSDVRESKIKVGAFQEINLKKDYVPIIDDNKQKNEVMVKVDNIEKKVLTEQS